MSVAAAMWEGDDSILIGADSAITDPDSFTKDVYPYKLRKHLTSPLAWAVIGNPTIGDRFDEWLRQRDWPPASWTEFQYETATKLAELNGKQRDITALCGAGSVSSDFGSALITGWLEDTPCIFAINHRGIISIINKEDVFCAIGGVVAMPAIALYLAFRSFLLQGSVAFGFRLILETTSKVASTCAPPVIIWRVKRDGVSVLGDEDFKLQVAAPD